MIAKLVRTQSTAYQKGSNAKPLQTMEATIKIGSTNERILAEATYW